MTQIHPEVSVHLSIQLTTVVYAFLIDTLLVTENVRPSPIARTHTQQMLYHSNQDQQMWMPHFFGEI